MAEVVVLKAVFGARYDQVAEGATRVDQIMREATEKEYPDLVFRAKVDKSEVDSFERARKSGSPSSGSPSGSPARGARPSTQSPERIARSTAAAVEQVERTSQARQNALAAEGESKRAAIEAQGAQRRVSADAQANARLEASERSHLQRMIQDKERAEARLAMKPRPTMAQRGQSAVDSGQKITMAGAAMTAGMTAPIIGGAGLALREGIKWESDFSGVRKTVNGSPTQLRDLEMGLRDMAAGSNAVPKQVGELAHIAESAGQLGVAREQVLAFTRTISQMSDTTNLSSEEAATSMAQIANITKMPQAEFERLGSTIVALGNDGASTEKDITELTQRLSGVGTQIGLSVPEIAGFGSALASVGVNAESGGTGISNAWINIDKIVREGGEDLDKLAKVAGMSAAQYKKAWQENAAGASVAFLEGIGKMKAAGGDAIGTLSKLGFNDSQMRDAMLRVAGAGDLLSKSLKTGESAWKSNTALADEAAKKYATTESQLEILQNRVKEAMLQLSDSVLKDANSAIGDFSKGIPEASERIGAAWEALGPAGKKAALGILAVTALSGPLTTMAGTVTTLYGGLVKVGALITTMRAGAAVAGAASAATAGVEAAGVGAAGAGAAGVGGAAALVSNPVGWVILAAAILAAIGLAIKFKGEYDEILARTKQLAADAKQLDGALKSALTLAPNSKLKHEIEQVGEKAKGAKDNVDKLQASLKSAQAMEIRIKDMKLDPATKDPLLQQVRSMIASIESQLSINIKVNAQNGAGKPGALAPRDPVNIQADHEDDLKKRAAKVGIAWPTLPKKQQKNRDDLAGMMEDTHAVAEYQKKIAGIEKAIVAKEKVTHDARFDTKASAALKTYSGNLAKLLEVQKAYNAAVAKGYKPDAKEVAGMGKVSVRVLELKDKVQADHKARVDKANAAKAQAKADQEAAAEKAAEKQKEVDEALADQRRAEAGRSIDKQLSNVNHISGQFEGQFSRISQLAEEGAQAIDEQGEKTAKAKAQAETLREEWNGTTKAVRDAHVEMAGLEVQMGKLNGLTQNLRQGFDSIAQGLSDTDFEKFSAFVSKVEGSLNLAGQKNALVNRANKIAGSVMPQLQGTQSDLEARREANQLAGRKPFDDPKNPSDGNVASVSGSAPAWLRSMEADTGKDFGRNCAMELKARLSAAGFKFGSMSGASTDPKMRVGFDENGRLPAGAMVRYPPGSGGYSRGHYMAVGSDQSTWTESNFAKKGTPGENDITSGRRRIKWEQLRRDVEAGRAYAFAPRGSLAATATAPASVATAPTPKPATAPKATRNTTPKTSTANTDYIPDYKQNGELLSRFRLPSSFGGSMAQYRARDGESTSHRQNLEAQLREVLKAADQLKPQKDGTVRARFGKDWTTVSPWQWKQEGARLDKSKTAFDARTGGLDKLRDTRRDLSQRTATAARPGEYGSLLGAMNRGDYNNNTFSERQEILAKTAGAILAEAAAANRDFSKSEKDKATVLAAGRPFLQGANSDLAGYARALAMAEEKQSALTRYAPLTQMAKDANAKADELEKAADKARKAGKAVETWTAGQQAEGFRERAKGFIARRDGLVAGDVKVAEKAFDSTALTEAQKALDASLVSRRQNIELLQFQNRLLEQGRLSQEAIAEQVEAEKIRREELKKLTDAAPKNAKDAAGKAVIEPKLLTELEGRAKAAADQRVVESKEEKKGGRLGEDTASALDSQRQIALLQRKLELTQQYGSGSPQLSFENRMADAESELRGNGFNKDTDADGNILPEAKPRFDRELKARESQIRAQMALETAETEKHAVEDTKIATLSAQREVLEATETNFSKRLEIQKWFENESRKIRGQAPMSPEENAEFDKRGEFEKQGEILNQSRQQAQEMAGIFSDGIHKGMTHGIMAGLKSISERLQQSMLDKEIEQLSNKLAGVPNAPDEQGGRSFFDQVLGRHKPQAPTLPGDSTPSSLPAFTAPFFAQFAPQKREMPQPPASVQNLLNRGTAGMGGGIAAHLSAIVAGSREGESSQRLASATFHIDSATQHIGRATMSGGLFGSSGASGGGAGTKKSFYQYVQDGADAVSP